MYAIFQECHFVCFFIRKMPRLKMNMTFLLKRFWMMEMIVQRHPKKTFYGQGNKVIRFFFIYIYPISFMNSSLVIVLTVYDGEYRK